MKKKLPPYGKQLKERMRSGYQPRNGVIVYTSWNNGPNGVTFPPDSDPDDYDWTFLAGQVITITNTCGYAEYEKLKQLAVLLVQSGAKSVGLNDGNAHPLQWYVPEVKGVAA